MNLQFMFIHTPVYMLSCIADSEASINGSVLFIDAATSNWIIRSYIAQW